jgi:pyruvate/2-oxoglutarate dehydrogenase complex dihydrolipoamide dehydrogenase (E3) component
LKVVVLGGGSTGEHFVGALRRLDGDAELTLVERRLVGGECSYWACMPTKTMLRGPEIVAESKRAPGVRPAGLDPQGVFRWRDLVVSGRDDAAQVEWLEDQRCELVRGEGTVVRPGLVQAGDFELPYDRLVIATGSAPAVPPIPGLDGVEYWTNVEATESMEVPSSLVVLGGGPVGCELAQFFVRSGSQVTLIEGGERILARIDPEATALVAEALGEDGVDVRLGSKVVKVERDAVVLESGDRLPFERLLVATGRRPNVDGVAALGLTLGPGGIQVDERLRAAESVWAIGDVTGIALFTHVGKYHARVAAYDMTGRSARADYRAVPSTIFTDPQVASVGALEGKVARWPLTKTPRLSTYERPKRDGFVKIAADPVRRVLNGAVAVGPDAGEWLQQLTLAIRAETPIEVLLDVIQPYPTFSEAVFLALRELGLDLEP